MEDWSYEIKEYSVYVRDGNLYSREGKAISNPAMLVDGDCLLRYGEYDMVVRVYRNRLISAMKLFDSSSNRVSSLKIIKFDVGNGLNIEDIAYIFRRAAEFTATGFILNLVDNWGKAEFLDWLKKEEERIPIQVIHN